MKSFFKNQLTVALRALAGLTIAKYHPGIIGITGSVGKTSAKEAVHAVFRGERRVRASRGNFNNEIGLPLAILGDWKRIGGAFFWLKVIFSSFSKLLYRVSYPELLILEYAADKPGDMKYLLGIARPQIGIVTAIGEIPAHVEFYSGPEAVVREKSRLLENLPSNGFAILNADDEAALGMRARTRAHVLTFGFSEEAEVRVTNFENKTERNRPIGISFKLEYGGSFVPVKIDGVLGRAPAYASAAAAAVGIVFGMNLVRIAESLVLYEAPPQRMRLVPGVKETYIVDDTYNASPLSMRAAFDAVKSLRGMRKVAVLGDMLEIGKYSIEAHEALGREADEVFQTLVTVGPRAKFIAEAAQKKGMPRKNILSFDTADEAKRKVQALIKKGDAVLVKGSRAMKLERIVEEIRLVA